MTRPQLPLRSRYIVAVATRGRFSRKSTVTTSRVFGQVGHDEAPTSQIPRLRQGHRKGKGRGDGRVDGIASPDEDVYGPASAACPSWAATACLVNVSSAGASAGAIQAMANPTAAPVNPPCLSCFITNPRIVAIGT